MTKTYRIADKTIEICSIYERVHKLCCEYECGGAGELAIETTEADIAAEAANSTIKSSPEYLEELAVYRKIAEAMLEYDTFLMHGSVIAVDGQAYMFTAASGTGKSTHARLWREMLGDRAVMVNDDKPLLRITDSGIIVYGTPWNGKHRLGTNMSAPLKAVCFLERAEKNSIMPVGKYAVYDKLLMQTYRPSDPALLKRTLALVDRLAAAVRLYRLCCNMEPDAARLAFETVTE